MNEMDCAREDGVTGLLVAGWLMKQLKKNNEDGLGMTKHTGPVHKDRSFDFSSFIL